MSIRRTTQTTQPTEMINSLISGYNNVGSIPLHGSVNSLIVVSELSATVYDKLSKQFRLTQYKPNMSMTGYDAVFVDCRGVEINRPFENAFDRLIALY